MSAAPAALAALRARFSPAELRAVASQPYADVLRGARVRRAEALVRSRLEETEDSARETPVIVALHAFFVEQEQAAGTTIAAPWTGELL